MAVGSDPRFGACYAIRRIGERLAMAKPSSGPGNVSRALSVNGKPCPVATWVGMSGRARSGLRFPCQALVSDEMFALAQEQLEKNKRHSPRRTVEPTLLQGILVCEQCGYGLYRTSTHTSKQKLNYYRCIGSDGYRRLNGPVCTNRRISQDYLDMFVWREIIRLLEDPGLIQTEIDHRREAAQRADPLRRREEELRREQARVEKSSERLVTAYQEGLLTLAQLRQRMPPFAETNAGHRIGITISEDGGGGRSQIPTTGREPGGISQQGAGSGRGAGHCGATADSATAGEGSSGRRQHDYAAPFDPDSAIRTGFKRVQGRHPPSLDQGRPQVIFCVRGVIRPPCGVPSTLGLTNPFSITPASKNARMSFNSRLSATRLAI